MIRTNTLGTQRVIYISINNFWMTLHVLKTLHLLLITDIFQSMIILRKYILRLYFLLLVMNIDYKIACCDGVMLMCNININCPLACSLISDNICSVVYLVNNLKFMCENLVL